jgi:hypothetical protein
MLLIIAVGFLALCRPQVVVTVTETITQQQQQSQPTDNFSSPYDQSSSYDSTANQAGSNPAGQAGSNDQLMQILSSMLSQLAQQQQQPSQQQQAQLLQPQPSLFSPQQQQSVQPLLPQATPTSQTLSVFGQLQNMGITTTQTITVLTTVTRTVPVPIVPPYASQSRNADRIISYLREHVSEIQGGLGDVIRRILAKYDANMGIMRQRVCSNQPNDWNEFSAAQYQTYNPYGYSNQQYQANGPLSGPQQQQPIYSMPS